MSTRISQPGSQQVASSTDSVFPFQNVTKRASPS